MPSPQLTVDVHLRPDERRALLLDDARQGLSSTPKTLSPVWFYDERGSRLFEEITRLREYYLTRAERRLLDRRGREIADLAGADTLVELGSGTSEKTRLLLAAMADEGSLRRYVPLDVDESTLRASAAGLLGEHPGVDVHGVVGDFRLHARDLPADGRRLVAFLGSTIGNLDRRERAAFLDGLHAALAVEDHLLLGVDLAKEPERLVAAYDDAQGVTAAFNRNALRNLGRETGTTLDETLFDHEAAWIPEDGWIEMRLRSRVDHVVTLPALGMTVAFRRGEHIRTEISTKFTVEGIRQELEGAGFAVGQEWVDEEGYLLVLACPSH